MVLFWIHFLIFLNAQMSKSTTSKEGKGGVLQQRYPKWELKFILLLIFFFFLALLHLYVCMFENFCIFSWSLVWIIDLKIDSFFGSPFSIYQDVGFRKILHQHVRHLLSNVSREQNKERKLMSKTKARQLMFKLNENLMKIARENIFDMWHREC